MSSPEQSLDISDYTTIDDKQILELLRHKLCEMKIMLKSRDAKIMILQRNLTDIVGRYKRDLEEFTRLKIQSESQQNLY